jgi:hypothetical protein
MKAIYINLDPYLQAVADWLNAGKPGTAPSFDPLPVAVTIPLGETACIYCPSGGEAETDPGDAPNEVTVDLQELLFYQTENDGIPADAIAVKVAPGLSAIAPSAKYWVESVAGDTSVTVQILDSDGNGYPVTIPVLVRREQAQGPVDLVDFTPPAAAIAAGTDLKGATFGGNEIVAAAGTGALSAPAGA